MYRYSAQEFDVQCRYNTETGDGGTVGDRLNVSSRAHDDIQAKYRKKWEEKLKRETEARRIEREQKQNKVKKSLVQYLEDKKAMTSGGVVVKTEITDEKHSKHHKEKRKTHTVSDSEGEQTVSFFFSRLKFIDFLNPFVI